MMRTRLFTAAVSMVILLAALLLGGPAVRAGSAASIPTRGFEVELLVDGRPLPQHLFRGARYVEALKGREYAIRLRNPLSVRVAVALAVDGLNTIDARHSDARSARKWVLDPHETVTIRGWQTSLSDARRFYFTTEEQSYATWLGKTANQGVISAVFFRERVARVLPLAATPLNEGGTAGRQAPAGAPRSESSADRPQAAPAPPPAAEQKAALGSQAEDYAATGIGRPVDHAVRQVYMDLEEAPVAAVDIRYEYRPQLVRLGVIVPGPAPDDPLDRRQHAQGFTQEFCPVPRKW